MGLAFEKTLRQPPPRHIDIYSQLTILLSGILQQMGWLFFGMGMLFVLIFVPFARIAGNESGSMPGFVVFVLVFPIVGLLMVVPGIRSQAKGLDLLRNGEFIRGKIRSKEHTGSTITINDRPYPVMKYTFDFEYQGKTYQADCKTHITEPLEDEAQETILYYPEDPGFNVVYDGITNSPQMDAMGNFKPVSWTKAWVFLCPAFSIFITGIAVLLFFAMR